MARKTDTDDGAMIVVTKKQGYYGEKTRYPGERFAITAKRHFSTSWMLDPADPSTTDEVASLERDYAGRFPGRKRDISDDKLLAEIAQTSGIAVALRAENIKLKEKLRELEKENAALKARPAAAEAVSVGRAVPAAEVERADDDAEEQAGLPFGGEPAEGAGDVEEGASQRRRRPR